MRRHWLMKSEPAECGIDDLAQAPGATLPWTGVRNYQARNFMRDLMAPGLRPRLAAIALTVSPWLWRDARSFSSAVVQGA